MMLPDMNLKPACKPGISASASAACSHSRHSCHALQDMTHTFHPYCLASDTTSQASTLPSTAQLFKMRAFMGCVFHGHMVHAYQTHL